MKKMIIPVVCVSILACGCAARQRTYACPRPVYYVGTKDPAYVPAAGTAVYAQTSNTAIQPVIPSTARHHTVKPGETMWSISRMYNVDLNELARANSIVDNSSIAKGQVLTIPASGKTRSGGQSYSSTRTSSFSWPVKGYVISRFGDKSETGTNKGIDISASEGVKVTASRAGKVVYSDSYLKGFGQTVILDHLDGYQTVYSYNSDILVKVGDTVRQGESIARVGQSGRASRPMLHFEIRRDGEPQNPARYLGE